jgi:hypothetical protein
MSSKTTLETTSPNREGIAEPRLKIWEKISDKIWNKIWDKKLGQNLGQTNRQTNGRTDRTRYRVALQLKNTIYVYTMHC